MRGSRSSGPISPYTKRGWMLLMSVSIQATMSPSSTWSDFHSASPLPRCVPVSGRICEWRNTGTPRSAAISMVRSVLSLSITTSWSMSGKRSMSAVLTRLMTRPSVFSSFSAGSPTLTVRPAFSFSATSLRMSLNSLAWNVFSANHLSTTDGRAWLRSA